MKIISFKLTGNIKEMEVEELKDFINFEVFPLPAKGCL